LVTDTHSELEGLDGWLILVGIGLVIRPVRILTHEAPSLVGLFTTGVWQANTTPGSPTYHPLWRYIFSMEVIGNLGILLVECFLLFLFVRRSTRFPRWFIASVLFIPAFILVDAWLVTRILLQGPLWDPETIQHFGRAAIQALIWVPYMLVSKRVKATFTVTSPARGPAAS
jgi:hypothetical protein